MRQLAEQQPFFQYLERRTMGEGVEVDAQTRGGEKHPRVPLPHYSSDPREQPGHAVVGSPHHCIPEADTEVHFAIPVVGQDVGPRFAQAPDLGASRNGRSQQAGIHARNSKQHDGPGPLYESELACSGASAVSLAARMIPASTASPLRRFVLPSTFYCSRDQGCYRVSLSINLGWVGM